MGFNSKLLLSGALPHLWEGKINTLDGGKVKTQGLCFAILIPSAETGECLPGLSTQASEHFPWFIELSS